MKAIALGTALVIVCLASSSSVVLAKGSGGGHGGGRGGGHASGGRGGGHSRGTSAPRGGAVSRATPTTPPTSASQARGSRSREGRPVLGTAVPRSVAPAPTTVAPLVFSPFRVWPYYGGGLGLWGLWPYYDPFMSGYGYPGLYSYGLPGSYPSYSAYGDAPYPFDPQGPTGRLRLKIEPAEGEVYVDGYYAGIVDDFDGRFQHLDMSPGTHHVEVRAPGYRPLQFDIIIQQRRTVVYRGVLVPTITR
jgi:hypothetical protein